MATPNASALSESRSRYWRRVLRPLSWWLLLVLLMFAYRTHQRLTAKTRLSFEPMLAGKFTAYESEAAIDGKAARSGQQISIGWHTLTVTHPKTKSFSTNLFVWYGENELGQIMLERATGMLAVNATPAARWLTIRGPEFSVTLTNTSGITSAVPTDQYVIEATYKYWHHREDVTVLAGYTVPQSFTPKLGMLRIEASHADATYQLRDDKGTRLEFGSLPATLPELPEGNYQLTGSRKRDQRELPVIVNANLTNLTRVEFIYGAAVIESEPPGAVVTSGGNELGVTPLTLPELQPGNFEFTARLNDYEDITRSLTVTANQTNSFRTNLVSRFYTRAMERANQFYADKSFERAAEAATEALRYKADDAKAKRMQRDATGHAHLARAESLGRQGDYAAAIKAANAAVETLDESVYAKTLLTDLTRREQERVEAEQKRQAELAEQKRKQEEAEQAVRRRQQNINRLSSRFYELNRAYNNQEAFSQHELVATNEAQSAATKINSTLVGGQPAFEIVKYEWPQADTFTIQARHKIGIGYRECLIVGGNVQSGEMQVLYKVFEYENPPELKLLSGFLTATTSIKITSQDPQVEQKKVERFQVRVKEGIELVKGRIQGAIAQSSPTKH